MLKAFEMIRAESQRLRVGLVHVVHRKCETINDRVGVTVKTDGQTYGREE